MFDALPRAGIPLSVCRQVQRKWPPDLGSLRVVNVIKSHFKPMVCRELLVVGLDRYVWLVLEDATVVCLVDPVFNFNLA